VISFVKLIVPTRAEALALAELVVKVVVEVEKRLPIELRLYSAKNVLVSDIGTTKTVERLAGLEMLIVGLLAWVVMGLHPPGPPGLQVKSGRPEMLIKVE
jgi:hypothetical protein